MPTTASRTYSSLKLEPAIAPELAVPDSLPLISGTYSRGQVLGQVTASKRFAPYNDGANDGREVARAVLAYACTVDSNNKVTIGDGTAGDEQGATQTTCPAYLGGYFRCEDLVGLDANAITDLGRLIKGTSTTGLLRIS